MPTLHSNNRSIIGIDVSKDKLDVYFLETQAADCWNNTVTGLTAGIRQLKQIHFSGLVVLEATGGYERLCHEYLEKAGFGVHVAHPKRVHHFIQQKGYFAKTDKIDARAIAEYGAQETLEADPLKTKKARENQDLSARRAQLVDMLVAEKCRVKDHLSAPVNRSLKRLIKHLEVEIDQIEKILEKNIREDEQLSKKANRLLSFKGVGNRTVAVLLSALPELGEMNRGQAACLCGLAPKNRDSGRKKGKRVISGGRPYVRKILYMAALASIRHNPIMKAFYHRLKDQGKASKVALAAVMRKIIVTLNAMLRDEKNWAADKYLSA